MDDIVILEWTFTPQDFFDQEVEINELGYTLRVSHGLVKANIPHHVITATPDI